MLIHISPNCEHLQNDAILGNILAKKSPLTSNQLSMKKSLLKLSILSFLIFVLSLFVFFASAQTVINFPTSGTWTCPADATLIRVECWGGGGAGAGTVTAFTYSGGGGGGGHTVNNGLTVVPGTTYTVTTGTGAAGGFGNGGNGLTSSFINGATTLVTATGGNGGTKVDGITSLLPGLGLGGAGGTGTFNGGAGANGTNSGTKSGGGGGGAGTTANGNSPLPATTQTGGIGGTLLGGNGGNGTTSSANGTNGSTYGGGGGGGRRGNVVTNYAGGSGANGFVRITILCTTPLAQPTSLVLTPSVTSISGSFTGSASANNYLVVRTTTAAAPSNPINGTTYTAGSSALGGFIQSAGTSTTFNATGLASGTQYWFWVFAYNATTCVGGPLYLTTSPLTNNTTTLLPPCVTPGGRPSSFTFTPITAYSITGSFTHGSGSNSTLVIMTTINIAPSNPIDGTTYTVGSAALGGTIVGAGTATSFTANGLFPSTTYYFWSFSYNAVTCVGGPLYNTSFRNGNATTISGPCISPLAQPTSLVLTPAGLSISGSFTASGSANSYLVVRTNSASAPSNPIDGTLYTAGAAGLGGTIVNTGTAITFNANGLTPSTQYWFWIFAYNHAGGCTGGPIYLTASPLTGTATTLACGTITNTAIITASASASETWSTLAWSLGHLPTTCENAEVIVQRTTGTSSVTIDLDLDVNFSVYNLTFTNASSTTGKTVLRTDGASIATINGNLFMRAPGGNKFNRAVYSNDSTIVYGDVILGNPVPAGATDGHAAVGSGSTTSLQKYLFYGNMYFNQRGYTTDERATFTFDKAGTQYIVNNTVVTDTVQPVLFETLNIGRTNETTVIFSGTAFDGYIENVRAAGVTIGVNSVLDLPAGYSLNKFTGGFPEPFILLAGAKLRLGGDRSIDRDNVITGVAGSNFPASFSPYNFDPTSTVEYYGNNTLTQTIYNAPVYTNLLATNGSGIGRAQKITIAAIVVNTSFNINALTDVTLGTLGSNTHPVTTSGPVNIQSTGGLYCNNNEVRGSGAFTMSNGSYLGIGSPNGITVLGNATGNVVMTGGRTYNTTGNYIYNALSTQVTGNGLPSVINELTIDNPTTVTIPNDQLVNGLHFLKQGIFDIGTTKITFNGLSTISNVSGKMKANLGTVEMKGTTGTAQNISGNLFVNKTISTLINANTKGINIAAAPADTLLISTAMNYGVGTTNSEITTNNNLTLLSRATATANFGEIVTGSGNTILGSVNIERYLFSQRAWRFLATPVQISGSPSVTTAWRESNSALTSTGYGTQITGPSGFPTFDQYTQRGSLKSYNPATNVWDEVTNPANTLANNAGYMVFVRGDRGVAVGGTTGATNLRIKGNIRTGDQVFNVPANKFQSFGNPYPSRIDFRDVTKNNIVDAFTVWNPNGAGLYGLGAYETYVKIGINYRRGVVEKNFIESGEAVFVQSNSATAGSVVVKEADKETGSALVSRPGVTRPTLEVNLFARDVDNSIYLADGVMLNFDNAYSPTVDNYDVRKIMNTADNLAVKNGTFNLVVERRPNLTATDTIKLSLTSTRVAPYRFDIDPSVLANTGLEAFLKDKFLQTETPVSFTDVTSVPFEITTDAASKAGDRFMIIFKQAATTDFTTISASRNADNTITVQWGIQNEKNVTNYTVEQSNDGINFTAIATQAATANNGTNPTYSKQDAAASKANNWYRVKANNTNGTNKYTAIAMVGAVNEVAIHAAAKMSIYPNPVDGGNVNLHVDNKEKGKYSVQINNEAGQQIHALNIEVTGINYLKTIHIGNLAKGSYYAIVVNKTGVKTIIPFLVN